jgi:hypothetical protein
LFNFNSLIILPFWNIFLPEDSLDAASVMEVAAKAPLYYFPPNLTFNDNSSKCYFTPFREFLLYLRGMGKFVLRRLNR